MELKVLHGMTDAQAREYLESQAAHDWPHLDASRFFLSLVSVGNKTAWAIFA